MRTTAFRASLGACLLLVGAYDVLQLLGEAAYARFAAASTSAEAEAARTQADRYGVAATATAGVLALAVALLVGTAGGGTISPP